MELIGLVFPGMLLQCSNYKRSVSRDSKSKVKNLRSVANLAQSRAFESLLLEI